MSIFKFVLFVGLVVTLNLNAHPGRTDSKGGHTCRTNCAKWGLVQGQYHYHNRNAQPYDPDTTTKAEEVKLEAYPTEEVEKESLETSEHIFKKIK